LYVNIYLLIVQVKTFFPSDYDQSGHGGNESQWYYDKQNKRKKKVDGPLGVDPDIPNEDGTSKSSIDFIIVSINVLFSSVGTDPTDPNHLHDSATKRDVHNFIFDDETVIVDDCSFVLPYIEGAYYYQSTTPPPATDIPLSNSDVNTDEYTIPLVPAYTEQQLKELLRRQV
jgi:hypothetical protein